jgi:hypothetical protein
LTSHENLSRSHLNGKRKRGVLNAEQVRSIREDRRTARLIAIEHGVSESCIAKAKRGATYREVA